MNTKLLVKRGLETARLGITPAIGEIIWTTDNHELWIGDGSTAGGIKTTAAVEGSYIPASQKGANNGVATLDASGLIPNAQLPALAITSTFVASSQTAQLALTIQEGDVCVRTDKSKSYIALNATNANMGDWQELLTPTDAVTSVNGKTGVVSLDTDDINEGSSNLYYTAARADSRVVSHIDDSAGSGDTQKLLSADKIKSLISGSVGAVGFTDLDDTPSAYSGSSKYIVTVNSSSNGIDFTDGSTMDGGSF